MAVNRSGSDPKKSKKRNGREKAAKNQFLGKSLVERLGILKTSEKPRNNSRKSSNVGLRVVDGRLLHANDVGVLLREAAARTESHNGETRGQKSIRMAKAKLHKPFAKDAPLTTTIGTGKRVEKIVRRRETARNRDQTALQPYGKDLYLSVGTTPDSRFLRLRNLPLGSDSSSLTRIVEKVAGVVVQRASIMDLPSGSVTAELWLQNSDTQALNEAQRRLDRANVNNRVISAEIASS
ncbi:LANO_0E12222g1_1 [Lachancea nothofagi CBS 11611]|uniref:LANO_0E12222g1_1 n=1 Tax=Lachancea nothofagi CBS 11611 TaxID=1266666 RepID=A0A1G4JYB0_9SACH|nr:LANO_0E12222g1_1 [Lachancea nothofagi CBS 11611]